MPSEATGGLGLVPLDQQLPASMSHLALCVLQQRGQIATLEPRTGLMSVSWLPECVDGRARHHPVSIYIDVRASVEH